MTPIDIVTSNYREFENNTLPKEHLDAIEIYKQSFINGAWYKDRPDIIKNTFGEYPLWGFYKCKRYLAPIRITGFCETDIGEIAVHVYILEPNKVSCYPGISHLLKDIIKVNKWSDDDIKYIESVANKTGKPQINDVFRHPLGYVPLTWK